MNRKCFIAFAAALLAALTVGCQCSGNISVNTPSPKPTVAATTPGVMNSATPDLQASPDASVSPGLPGSPGPLASPGQDAVIPDFSEGKEVKADEVPEVVDALKEQYDNGEIGTIKHATQDGRQVYAVEIKTGSTTEIVYVLPDGTLLQNSTPGTGNGGEA